MKRGPKPKPTALRIFEGNPSGRPINENEPKPEPLESFSYVDWMNADCEYMLADKFPLHTISQRVWDELVPQLDRLGLMTQLDKGKFARYCDTFARWLKVKAFIDKHGESYPIYGTLYEQEKQADGSMKTVCKKVLKQMRTFPQLSAYMKLMDALRKYEDEFGLSPSSRTRLQTIVENPLSPEGDPDHDFNYARKERVKMVK